VGGEGGDYLRLAEKEGKSFSRFRWEKHFLKKRPIRNESFAVTPEKSKNPQRRDQKHKKGIPCGQPF